jgi:hypothetical protein
VTPAPGATSVRLTKGEALFACQVLADADRCLVRVGRQREAGALGDLFDLLEARMVAGDAGLTAPRPARAQPSEGSYSMESEFTQ